mmetsp:Transcript_3577/g.9617  ORF Transcript_3577/g.9617 Transcript_3577/m.9617 type:complete len:231 (-) Transcript_3577:2-694(-)
MGRRVGLRPRAEEHRVGGRVVGGLLQEGDEGALGLGRHHLRALHLDQGGRGLRGVVGLRLQHLDGAGERLQGLLVVGGGGGEVGLLLVADVGGRLDVLVPAADVLVELHHAVAHPPDVGLGLLDVGLEELDVLGGVLDLAGLGNGLAAAPLRERGELDLLVLLVLVALQEHVIQQLQHFADWRGGGLALGVRSGGNREERGHAASPRHLHIRSRRGRLVPSHATCGSLGP